jgi:hypothetical protein
MYFAVHIFSERRYAGRDNPCKSRATAWGIEQRLMGYSEQMWPHAERQAVTAFGTTWIIAGATRAGGKKC